MRITSKGQVTMPIEIRERLGLLPNSEVEFEVDVSACESAKRAAAEPRAAAEAPSRNCVQN